MKDILESPESFTAHATIEAEGNKLIAGFMGFKTSRVDHNNRLVYNEEYESGDRAREKEVIYHTSWDWLMPVVEKIENMVLHEALKEGVSAFDVSINGGWCEIEMGSQYGMAFPEIDFEVIQHSSDSKLNSTWLAIVEFIQWYNNQNLNQ
jgi:hypothetical protein